MLNKQIDRTVSYWPMMTGLRMASMCMFSKEKGTEPEPELPFHVLIRTALSECRITAQFTVGHARPRAQLAQAPDAHAVADHQGRKEVTFSVCMLRVPAPMVTHSRRSWRRRCC